MVLSEFWPSEIDCNIFSRHQDVIQSGEEGQQSILANIRSTIETEKERCVAKEAELDVSNAQDCFYNFSQFINESKYYTVSNQIRSSVKNKIKSTLKSQLD